MKCPYCAHDFALSWARYSRAMFAGVVCPNCKGESELTERRPRVFFDVPLLFAIAAVAGIAVYQCAAFVWEPVATDDDDWRDTLAYAAALLVFLSLHRHYGAAFCDLKPKPVKQRAWITITAKVVQALGFGLRGVVLLAVLLALALAAWFGINATDETLSDEARAAMVVPPLPAPDRDNGFLDSLVLEAPAETPTFEASIERLEAFTLQVDGKLLEAPWKASGIDPRVARCAFPAVSQERGEGFPCPEARQLIEAHRTLLDRYLAMQAKARFVNLTVVGSQMDTRPGYDAIFAGQNLVALHAAVRFANGDRTGALKELQRDREFYRRVAGDATSIVDKMVAFALLDRSTLVVVVLARRMPRGEPENWRQIELLLRAPSAEELDVLPSIRREIARNLQWMQIRQHARLPESYYTAQGMKQPWWNPVAPYLYRPHQSMNAYVALCGPVHAALAGHPSTGFLDAAASANAKANANMPGLLGGLIVNPVGRVDLELHAGCYTDYMARAYSHSGVQTLARLLVKLRALRVSAPDDIRAALDGPLGREHPDPFTGKPMRFDPQTGTIGFEAEVKHTTGAMRPLRGRYGRVALAL